MLDQFLIRLDISFFSHGSLSFPELVPVDKEITVFGVVAVFQDILKLSG